MSEYKYLFIDAQYYLRRQYSVICNNEDYCHNQLLDSFLWVILKIIKNYPAEKVILLFDKRPYKKELIIKEYKSNRHRAGDEIEAINEKLKSETDESKIKELNEQLEQEKLEYEKFLVMCSVKHTLIKFFRNFGLVSVNEAGYEADDLARLFSLLAVERKEKSLLVSRDSDWICMANKYTDVLHYRNMTEGNYTLYTEDNNPYKCIYDNIDPFHYYQIQCILNDNHNNIELPTKYVNFSLDDMSSKIDKKELDDIQEFYAYYKALYIDDLMDDIKPRLLRSILNEGTWNLNDWLLYHEDNKLGVYPYYYAKTLKCLNVDLYKG